MTTIEHLAVVNLRLARRCGKLRRERDACGRDHWAADTLKVTLEHERRRSEAAEAKLADSERRLNEADKLLGETTCERDVLRKRCDLTYCAYCGESFSCAHSDAAAMAVSEHIGTCPKHPMREVERERDAEKARADRMETAWSAIGIRADKAEREVERLRGMLVEIGHTILGCDGVPCRVESLAFTPADVAQVHGELRDQALADIEDNERLRGIIGRALDRLSDILCGPDDKCRIDGSPADRAIVDDALRELREADAPPKRRLPADHKCVLCHGTGYYGDNGPGIKGNSEYQPCGCTMREADAPPAKPRRMKANAPQQGRQSRTLSEDVGKL